MLYKQLKFRNKIIKDYYNKYKIYSKEIMEIKL